MIEQGDIRDDSGDPTWSIALSGGGKRASLFALGALIALVETGANTETKAIASVSGGSIVNAAVATSGEFSDHDGRSFRPVAEKLFKTLTLRRHQVRLSTFLAVSMLFFVSTRFSPLNSFWERFELTSYGNKSTAEKMYIDAAVLLSNLAIVWAARNRFQEHRLSQLFRSSGRAADPRLAVLHNRATSHIFCLTDLEVGLPLIFRNSDCLSSNRITSEPHLTIAEVVTCSTAFPGAFVPGVLKMSGYGDRTRRRQRVIVSDGGVYNNLASDWFLQSSGLSAVSWFEPERGFIAQALENDIGDHVVVIDASAPDRAERIKASFSDDFTVWRELRALIRIGQVMYSSNIAQRQHLIRMAECAGVTSPAIHLISITESALAVAERLAESPDCDIQRRAEEVRVLLLSTRSAEEWDRIAAVASSMRTHLRKVRHDVARDVLEHGYYSMAVLLTVFGGRFAGCPQLL